MVRHRMPDPDPATGAHLTDVVGEVVSCDEVEVTVRTRAGAMVVVLRSSILAAKELPPRPVRRGPPHRAVAAEDVERLMVAAWPPLETEPLGDWVMRSAGGFTLRANSALVLGSPGVPIAQALDTVRAWYASRDLPAQLTVPEIADLTDEVASEVSRAGWRSQARALVLTAATREVAMARGSREPVTLSQQPDPVWLAAFSSYRSADLRYAVPVLTGSPAQIFATVGQDGEVYGIGRLALTQGWGGLAAMWVDPQQRRRGLATAMLAALAQAADTAGARSLHLQVEIGNDAAVAAYEQVGFTVHHGYETFRAPG